ncbi:YmdB family metallophosphoesterase [Patescibacteria group bacterium]|nr:YmdB family metallophosphoesterase [Patescibacteria group bacterium]
MNILLIGDVVGKIGRKTIAKTLPDLRKKLSLDLVVANVENIAHGSGVTENTLSEISPFLDFMTLGDHTFDKEKDLKTIFKNYNIIHPYNIENGINSGYKLLKIGNKKFLFINLVGKVFMKKSDNYFCPFSAFDDIYKKFKKENPFVIVDFHAETTSEKSAFFHYANDRANIIFGTHTHVPTSDLRVENNCFFVSDVGMVGSYNSVIGSSYESVIKSFLTEKPFKNEIPEDGETIFNSVLLNIDSNYIIKRFERVDIKSIV